MNYSGPSMRPTLQPGDLLHVERECLDLHVGDIVVFASDEGQNIVHRIVAMDHSGLTTRGDNNSAPDAAPIKRERLLGRVATIRRGKRTIPVKGAFVSGKIYAVTLLSLKNCERFVLRRLHPLYHGLAQLSWPKRVFGTLLKPKFLLFSRPEGAEIVMLIGPRIIGNYRQIDPGWQIRRPFRLLIDETTLPLLPKAGE